MRVTFDVVDDAPLPDPLRVAFPVEWAGRDDLHEDITAVDVVAPGASWSVTPDAVLLVDHDGLHHIRVSYRLDPMSGLLSRETRFRALFGRHRFFAPGHALLAQPLDGVAEPVRLTIEAGDDDWRLRSTLPDAAAATDLELLLDAAWFAGPMPAASWRDGDRQLDVVVEPGGSLAPEALAELAARVVDAQRGLLGPDAARRTTVLALTRSDAADVRSGTGRHGGFVLELGRDVDRVDEALVALVAHENLHRLIGHDLRVDPASAYETAWFVEGVTEYLGRLTAVRAGLLEPSSLFLRVAEALTAFEGNPARTMPRSERAARAWSDSDVRRLPYDQGVLLALSIDLRLRAEDRGSLEGWLSYLRDDPSVRALPLTDSTLRDALSRYSGRSWDAFWETSVRGDGLGDVRSQLAELGIDVVERLVPAPYYGVSWGREGADAWRVTFVAPGSPAERAGLYVGQELASEPWVPEGTDAREAWFDVVSSRGTRRVQLEADIGQGRSFSLVARSDPSRVLALLGLTDVPTWSRSAWRSATR